MRERGSGTRQAFDRAMHGLLPDLEIGLVLQHTEAIKGAVEAGLGIGCVSRIAIEAELRRGTLKACAVPHRDFRRRFFFLLHKGKYRTAGIERWLQHCRAGGPRRPAPDARTGARRVGEIVQPGKTALRRRSVASRGTPAGHSAVMMTAMATPLGVTSGRTRGGRRGR